ncbi:MAG: S8 family serine peptidase [Trueperaceae bacterium]
MKRRACKYLQFSQMWSLGCGLVGMVVVVVLAGCSNSLGLPEEVPLSAGMASPRYVQTLELVGGESIETVEERTGGDVLVWKPGEYALIGLDSIGDRDEPTQIETIVEENSDSFLAGGKLAEMNGKSMIWSGGKSMIWSGGKSMIWSGGKSMIWSGGEFVWMPENTATWQQVRLEEAQGMAANLGYGVTVAVVDTGVDLYHPGLSEALAPQSDWWDFFDDDALPHEDGSYGDRGYGHGTNVAGIVRQIAPRATILPLRVLGPNGQGDVADLSSAIDWAVSRGADIINLSLGADHRIQAVDKALRNAAQSGVFVFTSTGNTGDRDVTYPATSTFNGVEADAMVNVTSVGASDEKSDFATYHRQIELAAPGEDIFGPAPEERMAAWSGTSMAAPMGSGALALALGEVLAVERESLPGLLKASSADVYAGGLNGQYKNEVGDGRIDVAAFIERVAFSGGSETE